MIDMGGSDKKKEPGEPQAPAKEAFGYKIGQKTLEMTISATEINRVEPEKGQDLGVVEAKYHLRWEGVTGQGMEKDVTIRFVQATPDGTEEVMLQHEMMALMLEAKRRYVD
jgi:hypothetical protein